MIFLLVTDSVLSFMAGIERCGHHCAFTKV